MLNAKNTKNTISTKNTTAENSKLLKMPNDKNTKH